MIHALTLLAALSLAPSKPVALVSTVCEDIEAETSGTVDLVESDGRHSTPKSGTIDLWLRYDCEWHLQKLVIVDGHWKAVVHSLVTWADVGRVVLDGRESYVRQGGWDSTPPHAQHWTAKILPKVTLAACDAQSGATLANIEVREWDRGWPPMDGGSTFSGWAVPNPGIDAQGKTTLPGWSLDPDPEPLTGHTWTPTRRFWVRAPNHAWTMIVADYEHGADLVARLPIAAPLRVTLSSTMKHVLESNHGWLQLEFRGETARVVCDGTSSAFEFPSMAPVDMTLRCVVPDQGPAYAKVLGAKSTILTEGAWTTVAFE